MQGLKGGECEHCYCGWPPWMTRRDFRAAGFGHCYCAGRMPPSPPFLPSLPPPPSNSIHQCKNGGAFFSGVDTKGRLEGCFIWGNAKSGVIIAAGADPVVASCKYGDQRGGKAALCRPASGLCHYRSGAMALVPGRCSGPLKD